MRKAKIISLVLIISLLLGGVVFFVVFFTKNDKQAKVVATTFPIYDICREVMGGEDDLMLLESTGADLHSFEPTTSDIASISNAEVFIYIGGESDKWVPNVLNSAKNKDLRSLKIMDIEGLIKLHESDENILEEHHHEHHEGEVYDEHIWLSIKNMIKMTESIRDVLTDKFPENSKIYNDNAQVYINKLTQLDNDYAKSVANKTDTIIIADRFPLRYLVNDYKINYYAIFAGCSAESEASTETISTLINKINTLDVDYILVLETSDRKVANSCINSSDCKKGLEILEINSCQSIPKSKIKTSKYLDIMKSNLEILKKVITK